VRIPKKAPKTQNNRIDKKDLAFLSLFANLCVLTFFQQNRTQLAPYLFLQVKALCRDGKHPGGLCAWNCNFRGLAASLAGCVSKPLAWREMLREITGDFWVFYIETREKISSRIQENVRFGVKDIGRDILRLIPQ